MTNSGPSKQWRFFRAGGFDQVKLETGSDLMALDQLDLKLWVALACPTTGLEFDKATLALIDTDKDGRVRAPEVIAADDEQISGQRTIATREGRFRESGPPLSPRTGGRDARAGV